MLKIFRNLSQILKNDRIFVFNFKNTNFWKKFVKMLGKFKFRNSEKNFVRILSKILRRI